MPTNVTELRMETKKTPTFAPGDGAGVALFCMAGLVGTLVLVCYLAAGTPDLSDVALLVGP
jgi:hypothetical protein